MVLDTCPVNMNYITFQVCVIHGRLFIKLVSVCSLDTSLVTVFTLAGKEMPLK